MRMEQMLRAWRRLLWQRVAHKPIRPFRKWRPRLECLEDRTTPSTVVGGDFNGDGYGDLAIGAPGEDIGTVTDAGAVNVIYGTAAGPASAGNQFWHQNSPNIENANEAGDQFGWALAVGDFNGDGYDDLAIGSPYEDVGSIDDAGSVNVIYGSAAGLSATAVADQFWTQATPGTRHKSGIEDHYGFALAAADFNNDGYADLAIGVPGNSAGTQNVHGAGGVAILFGTATGLTATAPDDQWFDMLTTGVRGEPRANDNFGYSLAAGDFNHDGHMDLAVGLPGARAGTNFGVQQAGAVSVIYGTASGLSGTNNNQLWYQTGSTIKGAMDVGDKAEAFDRFGHALTAGDFNGDGVTDLAIGVPGEDFSGVVDAGAVHILNGTTAGLTAAGSQFWTQASLPAGEGMETGDQFGTTLTAADFNGDGIAELVVGVPFENVGSISDAGVIHVLMGGFGGLTAVNGQFWTQNNMSSDPAEAGDRFGSVLAIGDLNGDGRADLMIGVPDEDVGGLVDAGIAHVLFASTGGLSAGGNQLWSQDSAGILDACEARDGFGRGVGRR